jgi:hypothetical protein
MSVSIRIALVSGCLFASTAAAQDVLATARDLYASAAYEEALAALGRATPDAQASAGVEIDRYRALCLIALGRAPEAEKVIESIVASDPFYQPSTTDVAPRVRTAFSNVRRRMLPVVARGMYADAKAAFDRKAYPEAVQALEKTVRVIDLIEPPNRASLADLRLLAAGFLDLSHAAVNPPVQPAEPAPTNAEETAAASVPARSSTDLIVLKQDLPPLPNSLISSAKGEYRGIVEVDINEAGSVTGARMVQGVHAFYDPVLIRATRDWKYEAPRVYGKAIPSRKRVEIVLRP